MIVTVDIRDFSFSGGGLTGDIILLLLYEHCLSLRSLWFTTIAQMDWSS